MKKFIATFILLLAPAFAFATGGGVSFFVEQTSPYPMVVQFESNATTDSNVVFGVSPAVQTINDISGNSRNATQLATNAQGVRVLNAINGVQAIALGQSNGGVSVYNITNATGAFKNTPVIWGDDVVQIDDTSVVNQGVIIYSSTSGGRASWSTTVDGAIRISARRIQSDAAVTITTTDCKFIQGVTSVFGWMVDALNQQATVWLDSCVETKPMVFASGPGLFENIDSLQNPSYGRTGSLRFVGYGLTRTRLGIGSYDTGAYIARRNILQPQFNTPIIRLSVNEDPPELQNRVYRRDPNGGGYNKTFSVNMIVGSDAAVQYRIVDAATNAVKINWGSFCVTVSLTCSATVNFPDGSNFIQFKVAGQNDPSLVQSTNRVGVGWVGVFVGTSDVQKWWTDIGPGYPYGLPVVDNTNYNPRRYSGYGWFYPVQRVSTSVYWIGTGEPTTNPSITPCPANRDCLRWPMNPNVGGNGLAAFGLGVEKNTSGVAASRWPVGMFAPAIGGTTMADWEPGGFAYNVMLDLLNNEGSPGNSIDFIVLNVGSVEALQTPCPTSGEFTTALNNIVVGLRNLFASDTPVFVGLLGGLTSGNATDACSNTVRQAQQSYIANNISNKIRQGSVELDYPLVDSAHYSPANYVHFGYRVAQQVAAYFNTVANTAEGAKISGGTVLVNGDTITLTVSYGSDASTCVVDGSNNPSGTNLSAYALYKNGASLTIDSSELVSCTIRLTHTGLNAKLGDLIEVTYANGANPSTSNPTRGNVAVLNDNVGAPLQPTYGRQPITVTP